MSTRATYEIDGMTFYIHYDGYESGAAVYFANGLKVENERGGFAAKFFRGNDLAEFTSGHYEHGDTEYRYAYASRTDRLTVAHRAMGEEVRFVEVFAGRMDEFLNLHGEQSSDWQQAFGSTLPREAVTVRVRAELARIYETLGRGWIGNASGALSSLRAQMGEAAQVLFATELKAIDEKVQQAFTPSSLRVEA